MTELVRYVAQEWATLCAAPFSFALLLVVAFGAAFFAAKYRYESQLENLRERLETLRERLVGKDQLIEEYRERLHLTEAESTAFSRLSNSELNKKALHLVRDIRDFLAESRSRQERLVLQRMDLNYSSMTEQERHVAWQEETQAILSDYSKTCVTYEARFKVDTLLLREELLTRLPVGTRNRDGRATYENPTNPIGMGLVADDLERLAKSLPSATGSVAGSA